MDNNTTDSKALAVINGQQITVPQEIALLSNEHGNKMTVREYLQRLNKLPINSKQKLTDLKKHLKDAKVEVGVQIKAYNKAKVLRHKFSRFVAAQCIADATMNHDVTFNFGAKGNWIGVNTRSRFLKNTDSVVETLQEKIAELEQKLAEKSLPAPAKA